MNGTVWAVFHDRNDEPAAGPFETQADAEAYVKDWDDVYVCRVRRADLEQHLAELATDDDEDEDEDDDLCSDTGEHSLARCAVEGCQNYRDELEALAPAWTSRSGLKGWAS